MKDADLVPPQALFKVRVSDLPYEILRPGHSHSIEALEISKLRLGGTKPLDILDLTLPGLDDLCVANVGQRIDGVVVAAEFGSNSLPSGRIEKTEKIVR